MSEKKNLSGTTSLAASGGRLSHLKNDIPSGIVVFLVALPLCLGVALASGAPLISGILTGIVGGLVVSLFSGSKLSVSGPAAGLTAIVLTAITNLKTYEAFLVAVVLAGIIQIVMGLFKFGVIANYIPSNVIKGMLASIGIVLILKQVPHMFGYDHDTEGDFAFFETDNENTFSAIFNIIGHVDFGATIIAFISLFILLMWDKPFMKKFSKIPAPLVVVVVGVITNLLFSSLNTGLALNPEQLVNIPSDGSIGDFLKHFRFPDFTQLSNHQVYVTALTLAIVASIETLLSLEATDKLDPEKRYSPTNRELIAQGIGNITSGLIGGMPLTSVIVRSSVNIYAGAKTQTSSFIHGLCLLSTVMFIPGILNMIPLASLAAILILTGYKLAKVSLFVEMYKNGKSQFLPFVITVVSILFTDLLIGIIIGLVVSTVVILKNNMESSTGFTKEKYPIGEVIRLELAEQLTFLNKASILQTLDELPPNSKVILDASKTTYIDYDVVEIINDFKNSKAPLKNIDVSLIGFKETYAIENTIKFSSIPNRETQKNLTPQMVLDILKEGNQRVINNKVINKNLTEQIKETADGQFPMAAILTCIDSRTHPAIIFDRGLGEIFAIKIAGNTANEDILGSMEFACKIAGSKLLLVLGHTHCGAVRAACDNVQMGNLTSLVNKIKKSVNKEVITKGERNSNNEKFVQNVAELNVKETMDYIRKNSPILDEMINKNEIALVGAMYDIHTGVVTFYESHVINPVQV